ncbi:DNA adenine methylase [Acidovorax sp. PRC11]|uniref:DNA adenine methylase n=1 Tax=Acidovorax sp. PRC11 TaxID=2962592 RepID=UPI0028817891|nr:DNA adenine methylase [Acidovorax sp. PRC11]MDT0138323.1 DNA adenine methylase [Acidovorax sp. PRC11]
MPITDTPLRYPGGKSQLTPTIIEILGRNNLFSGEYAEPFAGGAGIAMTLLLNGYVSKIYLNDIDTAIYSFWYSVLHHTEELCQLIQDHPVNVEEWQKQRAIFINADRKDVLAKGFSTLFLNRTNRSGILRGGVIGGLNQDGNFKIDCRFNRKDLIRKIKRIALHNEVIDLHCLDAVAFVENIIPTTSQHTLVNLDPPYYKKGPELYTNFYQHQDHVDLAKAVFNVKRPWIVTYDDTPEIRNLYKKYRKYASSLNYSVQTKRTGIELLVASNSVEVPSHLNYCII